MFLTLNLFHNLKTLNGELFLKDNFFYLIEIQIVIIKIQIIVLIKQ